MSGFSFDNTAGTSQSTVKPQLPGNDIYEVKFEGCESKDFEGKQDPTKTFKTLVFKFSNEDGVYEHTIFEPTTNGYGGKSDFERGESEYKDNTGKINKIPQPSNVEAMMLLFKHVIDVVNPTVAKAIDAGKANLGAKDWDGIRNLVVQICTDESKGAIKEAKTKIKLIKNNKGDAKFPGFFSAVNREGVAYIRNNFIGDKVAFTPYELNKIQNAATAKPTDMSSDNLLLEEETGGSENDLDLDFDI